MRGRGLRLWRNDVGGDDWENGRDDVVRPRGMHDDVSSRVPRPDYHHLLRPSSKIDRDSVGWGYRLKWCPFSWGGGHWGGEGRGLLALWIGSFRHWSGRLFGLRGRRLRGDRFGMRRGCHVARNGGRGGGRGSSLLASALVQGRFDDGHVVWCLDMLAIAGN